MAAGRLAALAGVASCVAAAAALLQQRARVEDGATFVLQVARGAGGLSRALPASPPRGRPSSFQQEGGLSGSLAASSALLGCAAVALLHRGVQRSRVTCNFKGIQKLRSVYDRKWWHIEETRDPTTLPLWQRDFGFGYKVLINTMKDYRKLGTKKFWEVRVIESKENGCMIEMLNSGLIGFCPSGRESWTGDRLNVGDEVMMECSACPDRRLAMGESKKLRFNRDAPPGGSRHLERYPEMKHETRIFEETGRVMPFFTHLTWIQAQENIAKAKELESGTVIDAEVWRFEKRGMLLRLDCSGKPGIWDGAPGPNGFMQYKDLSRGVVTQKYCKRMFVIGTRLKVYVTAADVRNGRIDLSCKEFEDDDHVNWMCHFPDRVMANYEKGLAYYNWKKDRYIEHIGGSLAKYPEADGKKPDYDPFVFEPKALA